MPDAFAVWDILPRSVKQKKARDKAGQVGQVWAGCLAYCYFRASQNILDDFGYIVGYIALGYNLFDLGLKRTDVEIISDVFAYLVHIIADIKSRFFLF